MQAKIPSRRICTLSIEHLGPICLLHAVVILLDIQFDVQAKIPSRRICTLSIEHLGPICLLHAVVKAYMR